ncbi:hypothetical protein ACIRPT_39935 [Streptomyces sp. NPDC101227]|uniref:hypothetical protein n=1 Tax=Streptomyces sp. NPDC101227 TaxID=3366136 RepID=UPI00380012C7
METTSQWCSRRRRQWIDRALPQYAGVLAPVDINWVTAHGDCHFANLTTSGPTL